MKFEAEIIKEIVDSRGHTKTSIHYQSECVEEWVKEVEGAYPKLCDYQPEWLNYSAENKVGVFPYATLTDVTSATVENVVPYAYKSAILKGMTLVNCYKITESIPYTYKKGSSPLSKLTVNLSANKTYLILLDFSTADKDGKEKINFYPISTFTDETAKQESNFAINGNGRIVYKYTPSKDVKDYRLVIGQNNFENSNPTVVLESAMIIEYQQGMENWGIPYFEGMQSVKMPVLTTTGKNLLNNNSLIKGKTVGNTTVGMNINDLSTNPRRSFFSESVKLDIGEKYFLKSFNSDYQIFTPLHDENGIITQGSSWKNEYVRFIAISQYMRIIVKRVDDNEITDEDILKIKNSIMVCKSDDVEEYEPFKSNILTTSEDVELRGVGNVKDELNLLTGELTQRVVEVVLDGNAGWTEYSGNFYLSLPGVQAGEKLPWGKPTILSNLYPPFIGVETDVYIASGWNGNQIKIRDVNLSLEGLKSKLMTQPLVATYISSEESVKTVDLSVVDQGGNEREQIKPIEGTMHLSTSGETIKPLFSGEIPVEAITQNLASFIEE